MMALILVLFIRLMVWMFVGMFALTVMALWAFCWVAIFIAGVVWGLFDEHHKAKRLKVPRMISGSRGEPAVDAFGQPVPQSRFSNRR